MGKRKVGALEKLDADLASLQYKIRRDPTSYKEDFQNQYFQYETFRELFMRAPTSTDEGGIVSLRDLIDFIAHVADCYPTVTTNFSNDLINFLTLHHAELDIELREKIVGSLNLLRKKGVIDSSTLLQTLFPILVNTPSKSLRAVLYQRIVSDLRSANSKSTSHRLNRMIQTVLYNLISSDPTSPKGIWAVKITRELWRRQVWTDSKAVEIMKEAALADSEKVIIGGVRFFLGGDKEREETLGESSGEEDAVDLDRIRHQMGVNKKTARKEKELKRIAATVKKKERKKHQPHPLNFSALHLLHDPQGFAEKLFSKFLQNSKSKLGLENKLLILQLVSRLVGLHKLTLIGLYSYIMKYLTPRQTSVTSFLASLAQATHNLVPPDELEPLMQKIANEFVSEAAASEVASAGLNAIREVCTRQPLCMNETLLQDLVSYRKSKDKGVMMAARGLLGLYREVGPDLLRKRERGRQAALGLRSGERREQRFGEEGAGGIEGLELLEQWKEEEAKRRADEKEANGDAVDGSEQEVDDHNSENDWKAWEVEEDSSGDGSGGWIDVSSDGEAIDVSDSESEKERPAKKAKVSAKPADESADSQTNRQSEPMSLKPSIATTRILTPADLAKLNELRTQASVTAMLPNAPRLNATKRAAYHADPDAVTAANIEAASALSRRATKEEKIALAKGDRQEKHLGRQARKHERKKEAGKSSTNKEKERKKNFLMKLGKARGKMNNARGKGKGTRGNSGQGGKRQGKR